MEYSPQDKKLSSPQWGGGASFALFLQVGAAAA